MYGCLVHIIFSQTYFLKHLKLMVEKLYTQILNSYGNPWLICPSPLLSCLLEGCIDCGKDMTNGGSRQVSIPAWPVVPSLLVTITILYSSKGFTSFLQCMLDLQTLLIPYTTSRIWCMIKIT